LTVFRRFKFGTPEDHPDLGQSILAGDPLPDSKKWKFLGSVHGNPEIPPEKKTEDARKGSGRNQKSGWFIHRNLLTGSESYYYI